QSSAALSSALSRCQQSLTLRRTRQHVDRTAGCPSARLLEEIGSRRALLLGGQGCQRTTVGGRQRLGELDPHAIVFAPPGRGFDYSAVRNVHLEGRADGHVPQPFNQGATRRQVANGAVVTLAFMIEDDLAQHRPARGAG